MKYLEARYWSFVDVACLKWSSILFGVVVGAYISDFVQAYVWAFVVAFVALGIHPVIRYFRPTQPPHDVPRTPAGAAS
ncbi:MAG: UNC93-like protein MFSD11 [Candidatus Hydrogenedentes bacterium]|nr:UNC93-like protein MFSD11 [Candidatus Hydrogenedentota bacterium]